MTYTLMLISVQFGILATRALLLSCITISKELLERVLLLRVPANGLIS